MNESNKNILKTTFPSILFLATIGLIATDIYLPSFPAVTKSLATTKNLTQFSFSSFLLTFSLSQLFYGPYSEKYGRKKTALIGLIFSLFGVTLCIFSPSIAMLILGRALQGLGLGVGPSLFRAILRDSFSGNFLAHISSFIAVGTACVLSIAPIIGGHIQDLFGWRYNFVFVALYTIFGIVLILSSLPETIKKIQHHSTKIDVIYSKYLSLLKSPVFIGYSLVGSLSFAGLSAYLTLTPFLFQNILGLSPTRYGWFALFISMGIAAGGLLNIMQVKTIGRHKMLNYGIYTMTFASFFMLLLAFFYLNLFVIIAPMILYFIGLSIAISNSNAGALHHFPTNAGFAGSLYGAIQIFFFSIGSLIMVPLQEISQIPLSIFLCILSIGCIICHKVGYNAHLKIEEELKKEESTTQPN